MANTHVKTRSTLLITRDMQIKTAVRYHPTPIKMVITEKSTSNKCWRGSGEKGTLLHCWWECKLVQPPWKTVWRFLKKLKVELPYDPAITLLGIYPEITIIQKDMCTTVFLAALFTIAKKCPLREEMDEDMIHTHTHKRILNHKKDEMMSFATTWMDLEMITLK